MRGELGLKMLAALTVAKFVASAISLDCGAPGGVFGPIFFIGAMAGGTFHGCLAFPAAPLDGTAWLVRAGRDGSVSGRRHARAADGAVPAVRDDPARLDDCAAGDDRDDRDVGRRASQSKPNRSTPTASRAKARRSRSARSDLVLTQLPVASVMTKDVTVVRSQRAAGRCPEYRRRDRAGDSSGGR